MTDKDIKEVSDSINKEFFLIPRRTAIYWFGGFTGALAAIFGLGWATLRAPEIQAFITRVRANAEESDRLVTQMKNAKDTWTELPQRLGALEAGDYTPFPPNDAQYFKLSFDSTEQVTKHLDKLPKGAHQLLIRFYVATGKTSPIGPGLLTLSVFGPNNNELKYPFYIYPTGQEAFSYYSTFLWIPAPTKDLNIYAQASKKITGSADVGIDIIGWR